MAKQLVVRWTIGDVSRYGLEALKLSVCSAARLFGTGVRYIVCVNSMAIEAARRQVGALPPNVEWRDVSNELWPGISPYIDSGMAEGVAWKFAPLRIEQDSHELALDNDCILWSIPPAMRAWLDSESACLIAEDVRPSFGQFAPLCGVAPRNSGIRGLPPHFDLGRVILDILRERPVTLRSELDEQGLQVAAVSRCSHPYLVSTGDVSICSPFPPHSPRLGRCGAHFVGLNARSLPWEFEGTPALAHRIAHWLWHRPALYERIGLDREDRSASPSDRKQTLIGIARSAKSSGGHNASIE